MKSDKYKFLGMYGETPDMTGGFGQAGVDAFEKFLEGGGTLITTLARVAVPDRVRLRAVGRHRSRCTGVNAQKPLVQAEIVKHGSPGVLRLREQDLPDEVRPGAAGVPRRRRRSGNVLARFVGGDSSVLSGLMVGADSDPRSRVRGGHPERAQRQGPRDHVREQPDLPLAEPRRVQHGVQLHHQLERQWKAVGGTDAVRFRVPVQGSAFRVHEVHGSGSGSHRRHPVSVSGAGAVAARVAPRRTEDTERRHWRHHAPGARAFEDPPSPVS